MALRWYVVHAFSQYEKKVAVALKERIERFAMQERFGEIIVLVFVVLCGLFFWALDSFLGWIASLFLG